MITSPNTNKLVFELTQTTTLRGLQSIVEGLIEKGKEPVVNFSIFEMEEHALGADNQVIKIPNILSQDPVMPGKCIFSIEYWRVAPTPVYSKPYVDPTWKDIINACNELLLNGDRCGVFLESIEFVKKTDGTSYFEFGIGS